MWRPLLIVQSIFYALTGLWPLVHLDSFMAVTGPKVDSWLVKTVGVLVTVIGLVLALHARREKLQTEVALLAAGSAAGLAVIDLNYSLRGRISKIYLLDALAEGIFVLLWLKAWPRRRAGEPE